VYFVSRNERALGVFRARKRRVRRENIYHVVRYGSLLLARRLCRANVHFFVYLHGVAGDYLRVKHGGKAHGE
jgi:hypothetical protein